MKEIYSSVISHSPLAYSYNKIIYNDANKAVDYLVIDANDAFIKITNLPSDKVVGKKISEVFVKDKNIQSSIKIFGEIAQTGTNKTFDLFCKCSNLWLRVFTYSPEKDYFISYYTDISELMNLAYFDQLTGLYNHNYVIEQFKKLDRDKAFPVSIIYADINGLRNIVDDNLSGEKVIKSIAKHLKNKSDINTVVSRFQGDEFLILLNGVWQKDAEVICNELRIGIQKLKLKSGLSVAFGVSSKATADSLINDVLLHAINNMYREKLLDKNSSRGLVISSLLNLLSEKSFETKEHTERLQKYAELLSDKLNISLTHRNNLILLSKLHDIGKVIVPEIVLLKTDSLDDDEWKIVKRHCLAGMKILNSTSELKDVVEGIYSHHERWDGTGYPRQLKGKKIPLIARIISVVDSFDAMIHDRPYKKAMSIEQAKEEILKCAGTQFDPEIAKNFHSILEDDFVLS